MSMSFFHYDKCESLEGTKLLIQPPCHGSGVCLFSTLFLVMKFSESGEEALDVVEGLEWHMMYSTCVGVKVVVGISCNVVNSTIVKSFRD